MIFGGLSAKEVEQISKLLEQENIKFQIKSDENILESNEQSLKNNLRHLNPPSISTSVLAIEIEDNFDSIVSDFLRKELEKHGVLFGEVPEEFANDDSITPAPTEVSRKVESSKQTAMGLAFLIILVLSALLFLISKAI